MSLRISNNTTFFKKLTNTNKKSKLVLLKLSRILIPKDKRKRDSEQILTDTEEIKKDNKE